jgi:hypothetical protein
MLPRVIGLVRDSHPFFDARFSCREPIRFVGIALDCSIAAQMTLRAALPYGRFVEPWCQASGEYDAVASEFRGCRKRRRGRPRINCRWRGTAAADQHDHHNDQMRQKMKFLSGHLLSFGSMNRTRCKTGSFGKLDLALFAFSTKLF